MSTVTVGDQSVAWRASLTLAAIVWELGLSQEYALADLEGKLVWKKDWETTAVPDGAKIRFHGIVAGG